MNTAPGHKACLKGFQIPCFKRLKKMEERETQRTFLYLYFSDKKKKNGVTGYNFKSHIKLERISIFVT